ncbi:hypothetical protein [Neolewinella sp.]|uniref:hypothetical protein n=1 Tax=Neolewinella sp. TaxID=2993543 RepID=UPI003B52C786
MGLLKEPTNAGLIKQGEYPLLSASRYATIDKQLYGFVPIMSSSALMPQDYIVFPMESASDQPAYRFVDEFDDNNRVNTFFEREILSGLSDDDLVIEPAQLEIRTLGENNSKDCRTITVYTYSNYYIRSPDGTYSRLDYVTVDWHTEFECTGNNTEYKSYSYTSPGGSGGGTSGSGTRTQQQSGNIGVIAEHLCISATKDLVYRGLTVSNNFTVRLNDFAFEYRIPLSDGTFAYPVIRFNNIQLAANGVFVGPGPASNSPYGTSVAIEFETIIESAIEAAEGQMMNAMRGVPSTQSLETSMRGFFVNALKSYMNQSKGFSGASSRGVVADNNVSPLSTRTRWDPTCRK